MTVQELDKVFRDSFGLSNQWPKTYEVDADTYANVCQHIIHNNSENTGVDYLGIIKIAIRRHGGIMFRNVELILVSEKK